MASSVFFRRALLVLSVLSLSTAALAEPPGEQDDRRLYLGKGPGPYELEHQLQQALMNAEARLSFSTPAELVLRLQRELPGMEKTAATVATLKGRSVEEAFESQRAALRALRKAIVDQKAVRAALTDIGTEPKELVAAEAALNKADADLVGKAKAAEACAKAKCSDATMRAVNDEVRAAEETLRKAHEAHEALWDDFIVAALHKKSTEGGRRVLDAKALLDDGRKIGRNARENFDRAAVEVRSALNAGTIDSNTAQAYLLSFAQQRSTAEAIEKDRAERYYELRDRWIRSAFPGSTIPALITLDGKLDGLLHGDNGLVRSYERLSDLLKRRLDEERPQP